MLQKSERGVLLYLTQTKNVDLVRELQTLAGVKLDSPATPPPMDQRTIGLGAQILRSLGVKEMQLHTASPRPLKGLTGFGLEIAGTTIME
jgi:3,4-dihydroxy 2-butanone 4-phosphate synthase/GTP cyclohydrolase II